MVATNRPISLRLAIWIPPGFTFPPTHTRTSSSWAAVEQDESHSADGAAGVGTPRWPGKTSQPQTDWAGCGAVWPWVCPRKRKSLAPSHCSAAGERQQPPALLQLPRNLPRSLVRSIKRGSNQHRCEAAASPCGAASEPRCCHGHPVRAQRGWDSGSVRVGCGRPFT